MNRWPRLLRASWTALLLAALTVGAVVALYLVEVQSQAERARQASVYEAAQALAATLAAGVDTQAALDGPLAAGAQAALVIAPSGEVLARRSRTAFRDWDPGISPVRAGTIEWHAARHPLAIVPGTSGRRVLVVGPELPRAWMARAPMALLLGGLGLALVVALVLAVAARAQRADAGLRRLAHRLLEGHVDEADEEAARALYGEAVEPLLALGAGASKYRVERDDARALGDALLHLGPHYALLLTLDGRVIDANAAFLARTGLTPDRVRRSGALDGLLPLGPLLELARRSLVEGSALSGIPYQLSLPDGDVRPLDAALCAVRTRDGAGLVAVQLTDLSRPRALEHQIDQFTDALELMVDQRVALLTAGRERLEALLESAGLAVFGLDREGAVVYVNRVAELVTGRTQFTLLQFGQLAAHLTQDETEAEAFNRWFWREGANSSFVTSAPARFGMKLAWRAGAERRGGEVSRRILVGAPVAAGQDEARPASDLPTTLFRLDATLANVDSEALSPDARAYVRFIRDAIHHLTLETTGTDSTGDGAVSRVRSVGREESATG